MKLSHLCLVPIRLYQWCVSPFMGPACRFYPTCSHYAAEALTHHGALRGGWLALKRICRCHPWGGSGVDLVPGSVVKPAFDINEKDMSREHRTEA